MKNQVRVTNRPASVFEVITNLPLAPARRRVAIPISRPIADQVGWEVPIIFGRRVAVDGVVS